MNRRFNISVLSDNYKFKSNICSLAYSILLLLLLPVSLLSQNNMQFEHLTSIEGLSNNTVYDIEQDSAGYIWIATQEGLNRFDGVNIKTYYQNSSEGIPGNIINQLLVSSNNSIFIGSSNGLCVYNPYFDSFQPILFEEHSLGNIVKIVELSNSSIIIAAVEGLYILNKNLEVTRINTSFYRELCEYKGGVIWATFEDEIHLLNTQGEIIKKYTNSSVAGNKFDLSSNNIECIFKDSKDRIWIGTERNGLGHYIAERDEFIGVQFKKGINPVEDNFIRTIREDIEGRLWIGTESGLYIYDVDKQKINFYGQSFNPTDKGLNDKAIYSIYKSIDNVMWVGTYFGGVNYTNPNSKGFMKIYADGGDMKLSGNALSEIIETEEGKLWIGTEDGGISIYDAQKNDFKYLKHIEGDPYTLSSNNVHALEEDDSGNIWIGTFLGGINKYIKKTKRIEKVEMIHPDSNRMQSVFSIFIDSDSRIWAGAISGLFVKNPEENSFKLYRPETFQDLFIYHIGNDNSGNIWICSYFDGIFKIDSNQTITNYRINNTPNLTSDRFIFYLQDSQNRIWFGTQEGGLIRYYSKTDEFKVYTTADGLPNNTVYALTEDKLGNIWLSTNKGIAQFNPVNEKFSVYNGNDGLIGNQFNFKSAMTSSENLIYFGAVNGLCYFDPIQLSVDYHRPIVHFTDFKLFNQSLPIGEKNILNKHVNYQDEIQLKYKYNVFTIEFIGINYLLPENTEYAFYLDGFESDWNYMANRNNATYTNLSPGSYTFKIKAANGDGVWSNDIRNLSIKILPPFWLSIWGYLLYGFILISSILLYRRYSLMRNQEKLNIQMALIEKQKTEELNQHKLNFFTYISHEFKTPLSIVIATIDEFLEYRDILPKLKNHGILIKKNALRLLFLINQLMEFRKIETDHATLKLSQGELISYIRSIFDSFLPLLNKKSIEGSVTSNIDSYITFFDPDKIEKIISNIISNSYNSFEKPGTIILDIKVAPATSTENEKNDNPNNKELILTISDNGPGISSEKLAKLFEPYYTEGVSNTFKSGIGLALVRSLVNLLKGEITVNSKVNKGTEFIIHLPIIHDPSDNISNNELVVKSNSNQNLETVILDLETENVFQLNDSETDANKEYELLIVEDNKDLLGFLSQFFAKEFKVSIAQNGQEALEKIHKSHPDIIISDIMMPKMDGNELCKTLKESIETSHIPIILLTAKSGVDSKVEGLSKGADAYVNKPFNLKELELHVRNILNSIENNRKRFAKFDSLSDSVNQLQNKEQQFISKLTDITNNHLDNPNFNVDLLCKEALISRTQLHMKLKKITGLSTSEFIKTIRLNEAKNLLQTKIYTISEVAYKVGYSDPTYFSKSFKKLFNNLPSYYIKGNKQQE